MDWSSTTFALAHHKNRVFFTHTFFITVAALDFIVVNEAFLVLFQLSFVSKAYVLGEFECFVFEEKLFCDLLIFLVSFFLLFCFLHFVQLFFTFFNNFKVGLV